MIADSGSGKTLLEIFRPASRSGGVILPSLKCSVYSLLINV